MIRLNDQQKSSINSLKPLTDSSFLYNKKKWNKLNSTFKNTIQDFEDKKITRQNIIDAYEEYYDDNSTGFMKAFLLTMVWGFAETGYGTYRTNNYISSNENREIIKNALDSIENDQEGSLKEAFEELKKIKGLGISYLTKILYFATRAKKQENYALIFDNRVAASLIKLTTPKEIFEIINIGPSSKFNDYQKFNQLIHKLAKDNEVEADQLEMYLFNQVFE